MDDVYYDVVIFWLPDRCAGAVKITALQIQIFYHRLEADDIQPPFIILPVFARSSKRKAITR